jgi:hypothetical protein
MRSNTVIGVDLVNWKMWSSISEKIPVQIFAGGTKYSTRFGLEGQTTQLGKRLEFLREMRNKGDRKIANWLLYILEAGSNKIVLAWRETT